MGKIRNLQFNNLTPLLNSGSITIEEVVLELGDDGLINVVGIIAFVIFINWYNSLFVVKAFQANLFDLILIESKYLS